jgi:hypothetical protein
MTTAAFPLEERFRFASSRRSSAAAMVAIAALWVAIELVGSLVFRSISMWEVVLIRYTIHLAIVIAIWGPKAPWRTSRLRDHLTRSALMLVMPGAFVLGASSSNAGSWINTIFWAAPLMVIGFATLLDRERAAVSTWCAAGLGWVAAWLYFAPSGVPSLGTIAAGLAMGGSFALYIPLTRRLRNEPLRTNLFYTATVPWLALLPLMPRVWVTPGMPELLGLLFIGAGGWVVLLLFDRAADAAPVSHSAPLLHLQTGFIMVFTLAAQGYPGPKRTAAVAVLLVATAALTWPAVRRDTTEAVA